MEAVIPEAVLNSGEKIPMIAMGTAPTGPLPDDVVSTFVAAMEMGYRHCDTAAVYGTEKVVGEAIAQALQQGAVKTRDELFVTSKLWCADAHHDRVLPALKQTLEVTNAAPYPKKSIEDATGADIVGLASKSQTSVVPLSSKDQS